MAPQPPTGFEGRRIDTTRIAAVLGRSASTICRELPPNCDIKSYWASLAIKRIDQPRPEAKKKQTLDQKSVG